MEKASVKLVRKKWRFIDEHVMKIKDHDESSYKSLIDFFDIPIKSKLERDIYMTRAIIFWMYKRGQRKDWKGIGSSDNPLKLMKLVHEKQISRQDAFKTLCNNANIPCECITGIVKLASFEPGQRDFSDFRYTWNKVKLEGSWWPVYPDWIMVSVAHDKSIVGQFTDFWFLTDPEIFIYKCFPDNTEDQMLPVAKQVKNARKFAKLPLLSYHFFKHNLKLTSENSSVLDADDGKCIVSFKADSALAKTLNFFSELTLPDSSDTRGETFNAERLVFNSRRKGHFFFEVRCPVLGVYKLVIRGGPTDGEVKKYLTETIECLETKEEVGELPIVAGTVGWGFGPTAAMAGLSKPTVKDPKIVVPLKKEQTFGLTLDEEKAESTQFEAKLHHSDSGTSGNNVVKVSQSQRGLQVKVTVRDPGEHALTIYASGRSSGEGRDSVSMVCNYLLSTLEDAETVAEEYEDSSDGFSDIDEENFELEREITQLEEKYNELLRRAESATPGQGPRKLTKKLVNSLNP